MLPGSTGRFSSVLVKIVLVTLVFLILAGKTPVYVRGLTFFEQVPWDLSWHAMVTHANCHGTYRHDVGTAMWYAMAYHGNTINHATRHCHGIAARRSTALPWHDGGV